MGWSENDKKDQLWEDMENQQGNLQGRSLLGRNTHCSRIRRKLVLLGLVGEGESCVKGTCRGEKEWLFGDQRKEVGGGF